MTVRELIESTKQLLEKKKKNDGAISEEDKKGRYKKTYSALVNDCRRNVTDLYVSQLILGFQFCKDDAEKKKEFQQAAKKVIEKNEKIICKAANAAVESCDIYADVEAMDPVHAEVENLYMDYWQSKCQPTTAPGYSHYNLITGMWFHEEMKQWVMKGPDGKNIYKADYPPVPDGKEKVKENGK